MKKSKIFLAVAGSIICLALMTFGVWAATTSLTFNLTGSINYDAANVKASVETVVYQTYSMDPSEAHEEVNRLASLNMSDIPMKKAKNASGEDYYHKYATGTNSNSSYDINLDFNAGGTYFIVFNIKSLATDYIKTSLTDNTNYQSSEMWSLTSETTLLVEKVLGTDGTKIVIAVGLINETASAELDLDITLTLEEYVVTDYMSFSQSETNGNYSVRAKSTSISGDLLIPNTYNGAHVVTIQGGGAFSGCTGLTSITIPESISTIWTMAFYNCSNVRKINYNAKSVTKIDNGTDAGSGNAGMVFCGSGKNCIDVVLNVGYNVTCLPIGAFASNMSDYTYITHVNFWSDKIASIPKYTFYQCFYIQIVNRMPQNLQAIEDYAFYENKALINIEIAEDVTYIGKSAFNDCYNMQHIAWNAKKVKDFATNDHVFYGCANSSGSGSMVVEFGENVERIPAYAFWDGSTYKNATNIQKVYFTGTKVEEIGDYAFYNSLYDEDLTLPEGLKVIGSEAFVGCCTTVTKLTIPTGVTSIGFATFSGWTSLAKIVLPATLTTIDEQMFYNCPLTNVYFRGSSTQWNALGITESNNSPLYNATKSYNYTGAL